MNTIQEAEQYILTNFSCPVCCNIVTTHHELEDINLITCHYDGKMNHFIFDLDKEIIEIRYKEYIIVFFIDSIIVENMLSKQNISIDIAFSVPKFPSEIDVLLSKVKKMENLL